ncbi:MAG: hypothetical protein IKI21_00745 [Oscillospiraceae bacterium]|nr:hypothetical protein [Oscillospiraceae bacterium]
MNELDLMDAIGDLPEAYVEEALETPQQHRGIWRTIGYVAAAACLVVAVGLVQGVWRQRIPTVPLPETVTETVVTTTDTTAPFTTEAPATSAPAPTDATEPTDETAPHQTDATVQTDETPPSATAPLPVLVPAGTAASTSAQRSVETAPVTVSPSPTERATVPTVTASPPVTTVLPVTTAPTPTETGPVMTTMEVPEITEDITEVTDPITEATTVTEIPVTFVTFVTDVATDDPTDDSTTNEQETTTTYPEILPGFRITDDVQGLNDQITYTTAVKPSPATFEHYTLPGAYRVRRTEKSRFLMQNEILPEKGTSTYKIMQYRREQFSVTVRKDAALYPADVGGYPAFYASYPGGGTLFWDDGQYTFQFASSTMTQTQLEAIASQFVPVS